MKKVLLTFGTTEFYNAMDILIQSGRYFFDSYARITEKMLPYSFYRKHESLFFNKRGFGYWIWKPFIILKCLDELDDGDLVFYVDSTNRIVNSPNHLLEKTINNNIVLFDNRDGCACQNPWTNELWIKYDCYRLMDIDVEHAISKPHLNASYQIYKKCRQSELFVTEYLNYCSDPQISSDKASLNVKEFNAFREHRHDQSILSLLALKFDIHLTPDPSVSFENNLQVFDHYRGIKPVGNRQFIESLNQIE